MQNKKVWLCFVNFYGRFIQKLNEITVILIHVLKITIKTIINSIIYKYIKISKHFKQNQHEIDNVQKKIFW